MNSRSVRSRGLWKLQWWTMSEASASRHLSWMPHLLMSVCTITRLSITHWWLPLYPPSTHHHPHLTIWQGISNWIAVANLSQALWIWEEHAHAWCLEVDMTEPTGGGLGIWGFVSRWMIWASSSLFNRRSPYLLKWQCGMVSTVPCPWQRSLRFHFCRFSSWYDRWSTAIHNR
jgi:hypothetical protein